MIPIRLQLKNFMSYGEGVPPLDLTGVRLACLSGDNGNGKSALLDAITWALFGETRARTEDDVVRLGARDCAVFFDFEVGGTRYRVKRQRDRRGGALWELQVWQEDGATRSLSGTNARETKAKIEALLRMDYKTFVSTAYLAQGQSDIFARATPGDRKKVLADILDLSRYERLEQMARERQKEADVRAIDAERELSAIDAELEREDELLAAGETARERLAEVSASVDGLQVAYEAALARCERLEMEAQKQRDLEEKIHDAQLQIAEREREIGHSRRRLEEAQAVLVRRAEIETAHARSVTLTERLRPLEEQYHRGLDLQREANDLEASIRRAAEEIERERYRLATEIDALEQEVCEVERYDAEIARLAAEIQAYGNPERRRAAAENAARGADAVLAERKAERGVVLAESAKLDRRIAALAGSDASVCDYCGQPLSPKARQEALAAAEQEKAALEDRLTAIVEQGKEAKRESDRRRQEAESALADLRAVHELAARQSHAEQERLRLNSRAATLPDLRARRDALVKRLKKKDFAPAEQERLMQVSAQTEKLERIGQEVARLRAESDALRGIEREVAALEAATAVAQAEPERIAAHDAFIADRRGRIEKARLQVEQARVRTDSLPTLLRERDEARRRWDEAQQIARDAERTLGQIAAQTQRLEKLKQDRVRWEEERRAATHEKELYRELSAAFGKKGVQALIIENALPEIEEEANRLLSRMTQGAMNVRLLTQREAKTKAAGAIETLDILIADDMGTRPYELYSGGEAFRINLALRVALSKMLARRAGAPLQTLILDEGFGTQDPRGREAIADALQSVSEDFALVLVITHVDELKEQFPTRIEVMKGPAGSTFTVV